jgi:hypothetical protein
MLSELPHPLAAADTTQRVPKPERAEELEEAEPKNIKPRRADIGSFLGHHALATAGSFLDAFQGRNDCRASP